jgi:hypothetical protein
MFDWFKTHPEDLNTIKNKLITDEHKKIWLKFIRLYE